MMITSRANITITQSFMRCSHAKQAKIMVKTVALHTRCHRPFSEEVLYKNENRKEKKYLILSRVLLLYIGAYIDG